MIHFNEFKNENVIFSSHTYLNDFKDFHIKQMSVKYETDFDLSVKLSE